MCVVFVCVYAFMHSRAKCMHSNYVCTYVCTDVMSFIHVMRFVCNACMYVCMYCDASMYVVCVCVLYVMHVSINVMYVYGACMVVLICNIWMCVCACMYVCVRCYACTYVI